LEIDNLAWTQALGMEDNLLIDRHSEDLPRVDEDGGVHQG
jgi:hypothetical protein